MIRAFAGMMLLLGACAMMHKDSEDFMDDVRTFQEGIRWRKYDMAVEYLPTSARTKFLDSNSEMDNDLRIDDYEITVVHLESEHKAAKVQVKYTWHLDSVGSVHDTTVEEHWKKMGKAWHIVGSEYKRGSEDMPVLVDIGAGKDWKDDDKPDQDAPKAEKHTMVDKG